MKPDLEEFEEGCCPIFPRIQGIRDRDESWWRLVWFFVPQDLEGVILVPVVILLTLGLFALVAGPGRTRTVVTARRGSASYVVSLASSV